ncbi:MAG TPA: DUF1318 domain-containing protein [Candidatus Omnitrophota bacterium]|nr:DUF1318 domain-containing protein [Candidatus Omnitrophota bacterium]
MKRDSDVKWMEVPAMKRMSGLMSLFFLAMLMAFPPCFAAQYDFKKMTPEINQALKNRQARYGNLQRLKQAGLIGENNQGYVTNLKSDPLAVSVASAENTDRGVIYRALVQQNTLGPNGMREVQRAFAEVQNEKASAGEFIQTASGDWIQKSS